MKRHTRCVESSVTFLYVVLSMIEKWKLNLAALWVGCFLVGLSMSQILPFLPIYLEQLGIGSHASLSIWSGVLFSCSFLVSALIAPYWGKLADQKGRKLMLLRASLGMAIIMGLQGLVSNPYQLLFLRSFMGLTSGYIPNAMALAASEMPKGKTGWALGTLSTGQICGVILGPLLGGAMADHIGLRIVFFITSALLFFSFITTWVFVNENFEKPKENKSLTRKEVFQTLPYPAIVVCLFVTTMTIQLANGTINPILTLFVKQLSDNVSNIAFISGVIASIPGVSALISAPYIGKIGDRIGPQKILVFALSCAGILLLVMSLVTSTWQLGVLRFLLGFTDGALMPAVQTLLVRQSNRQVLGRVFGYNQSFMYLGNVVGPLLGACISASFNFRWVFVATAMIVVINLLQLIIHLRPAYGRAASSADNH